MGVLEALVDVRVTVCAGHTGGTGAVVATVAIVGAVAVVSTRNMVQAGIEV